MVKKEKLIKKSKFLQNVNSLKNLINGEKLVLDAFPFSSRDDYIAKIYNIIIENKDKEFSKEKLLI
ncbi:MAG TPA: hypothetical protein VGB37_16330 [Candidatus Lokiarchaeia archaeon]